MKRWRGLSDLVQDAVQHGTATVEKVHQQVARTPLDLLAHVPPLASTARWMADRQASLIAATYGTIREVSAAMGALVGTCIDVVERSRRPAAADAEEDDVER
jgi:hypothetical protein